MEYVKSNQDVLGLSEDQCEECNGTGSRLSLDLDSELVPCEWCDGTGQALSLDATQ